MIEDVKAFHDRFGLVPPQEPQLMNDEVFEFRITCMHEELTEFIDAHESDDIVKAADALVDLVYFALGTALHMGIQPRTWNQIFAAVQRANMSKVRAENPDQSKRGSTLDVVKPEGFVPPDAMIGAILQCAGWTPS